jgi:hypothetical protein
MVEGIKRIEFTTEGVTKVIRAHYIWENLQRFLQRLYGKAINAITVRLDKIEKVISNKDEYRDFFIRNRNRVSKKLVILKLGEEISSSVKTNKTAGTPEKSVGTKKHKTVDKIELGEKRPNNREKKEPNKKPKNNTTGQIKIDLEKLKKIGEKNYSDYICYGSGKETLDIHDVYNDKKYIYKNEKLLKSSRFLCMKDKILGTGGVSKGAQAFYLTVPKLTIKELPNLNTARYWHTMGYIDGFPAVIGGLEDNEDEENALDSVEVLKKNKWEKYSNLNKARSNPSCSWVDKCTYVLGGSYYDNNKLFFQDGIEKWDGKEWTLLDLKLDQLFKPGFLALSNHTFIVLGGLSHNKKPQKEVYIYELEPGNHKKIEIQSLQKPNFFPFNQITLRGDLLHLIGIEDTYIKYQIRY